MNTRRYLLDLVYRKTIPRKIQVKRKKQIKKFKAKKEAKKGELCNLHALISSTKLTKEKEKVGHEEEPPLLTQPDPFTQKNKNSPADEKSKNKEAVTSPHEELLEASINDGQEAVFAS